MTATSLLALCIPGVSAVLMCCGNCTICPLVAAMILTGIRRLNDNGALCAQSTAISEADTGATFEDNGATMRALFIAQCVMYIPTFCCFNFGFQFSLVGDAANNQHGTGVFQALK